MALGNSDITETAVATILGISTDDIDLGELCLSIDINKWSRYKPVRGDWPLADDGLWGYDIPDNWLLIQPRGDRVLYPTEGFRLGDFRGYEHDNSLTYPPAYCKDSDQNENAVLSPAQPSGGFSSGGAKAKFNTTNTTIRVRLTDMGLGNFYFGVRITTPTATVWAKSVGTVVGLSDETTGLSFTYQSALDDPTDPLSTYQNLPYGVGSFTVEYIISSINFTDWTENPTGTIYLLPSGSVTGLTFKNTFNFTVEEWISTPNTSLTMAWDDDTSAEYQSARIFTSVSSSPWTVDLNDATWAEYEVYASDNSTNITNTPSSWGNGAYLRVFPININNGPAKNGTILINVTGSTAFPINVTQGASPATIEVIAGDAGEMTVSATSAHTSGGLFVSFTPHYIPDDDINFTVGWIISVNSVGNELWSSELLPPQELIAASQDTPTGSQEIDFGTATWNPGDTVYVKMYYGNAPPIS